MDAPHSPSQETEVRQLEAKIRPKCAQTAEFHGYRPLTPLSILGPIPQANALLCKKLLPEFNRRFTVAAARRRNAHRDLGPEHCLPRILCVQHRRSVANDYTVRFFNWA